MAAERQPQPLELIVGELALKGLHYDGEQPVIVALHGWMDNAESFVPVMQQLPNEAYLIDLPGHGHSDHRGPGGSYEMASWGATILGILDAVGQRSVVLIGHSMGGSIAMMGAAIAPDRVSALVLVESSGPLSAEPDETVVRLRAAAQAAHKHQTARVYANAEAAIRRRQQGWMRLPRAAAEPLVRRGIRPFGDGVVFRHDRRLARPSAVRMTEAQVRALIAGVTCPTLLIIGDDGYRKLLGSDHERLSAFRDLTTVDLEGGHHVHMTDPTATAAAIRRWLRRQPEANRRNE